MLAKSGVVTKQPRAQWTGERRFLSVLLDMDLKFEVVIKDQVTKATNPGPLLVLVIVLEMRFEFVKFAVSVGALEARIHLKYLKMEKFHIFILFQILI